MSRGRRKLQAVPVPVLPADEQVLLVAYRAMDDRARRQTLRVSLRFAAEFPAPAQAQTGPRLIAIPAAALPLLKDFCSMSASAQHDVCCMVAGIAIDEAAEVAVPVRKQLRLIAGGLS